MRHYAWLFLGGVLSYQFLNADENSSIYNHEARVEEITRWQRSESVSEESSWFSGIGFSNPFKGAFDFDHQPHFYGPIALNFHSGLYGQIAMLPASSASLPASQEPGTSTLSVQNSASENNFVEVTGDGRGLDMRGDTGFNRFSTRWALDHGQALILTYGQLSYSGLYSGSLSGTLQQSFRNRPSGGLADPSIIYQRVLYDAPDEGTTITAAASLKIPLGRRTVMRSNGRIDPGLSLFWSQQYDTPSMPFLELGLATHVNIGGLYLEEFRGLSHSFDLDPLYYVDIQMEIPFHYWSFLIGGHFNSSPFPRTGFSKIDDAVEYMLLGGKMRISTRWACTLGYMRGQSASAPNDSFHFGLSQDF